MMVPSYYSESLNTYSGSPTPWQPTATARHEHPKIPQACECVGSPAPASTLCEEPIVTPLQLPTGQRAACDNASFKTTACQQHVPGYHGFMQLAIETTCITATWPPGPLDAILNPYM